MWQKSDMISQHIIYRYDRSFTMANPYIGLFKMRDGNCRMIVQDFLGGYEPITDGLQLTQIITFTNVKWTFSKTMGFSTSEFDSLYNTIVDFLYVRRKTDFPRGLDGDDLTIEIKSSGGHSSTFDIWYPHESPDDKYHFNAVYLGFVNVLKAAGLFDWYNK